MAQVSKAKTEGETQSLSEPLMTGIEVLALCRVTTPTPRQTLMRWRREGLEAVRVGQSYKYTREAVQRFIQGRTIPGGYVRISQVGFQLRTNPQWLRSEIEAGRLPGMLAHDGMAFADPKEVREALREREQQAALARVRGKG